MREERVERVVERLKQRGVFAHVHREGVFRLGIRVVLPDGREAIWDDDGAAGLEAQIVRDGVLVGFVPLIEGSEDYDDDRVVATIAAAVYP